MEGRVMEGRVMEGRAMWCGFLGKVSTTHLGK